MKNFILSTFLFVTTSSTAFAGWECFLTSPARVCVINVDMNEDFFSVNRPDQEICRINIVSTAERYNHEGSINLISELRLRSRNVDTGVEVSIVPELNTSEIIGFQTGGVFGYANNYHIKSPTTETLKEYFKRVLQLQDADIVFVQAQTCE